jgi:hypothetical protein
MCLHKQHNGWYTINVLNGTRNRQLVSVAAPLFHLTLMTAQLPANSSIANARKKGIMHPAHYI